MYLSSDTILHNRYVIESILGHGGFGITYAAHDKTLNVRVAIKEYLPRQLATRGEGQTKVSIFTGEARQQYDYGLRKFLEEAQSVARFAHHPNVVSARDYFEANGTAYMVMEYVEGVTLKEYLAKRGGRISFEEAKGIMMPVMDALREVHQAGMLHRDVSPDNIYITTSSQVKILDFGAARYFAGEQSKSLSVILKPGYAPEEQYRSSGKQGSWTDVYAVGATIYKALTGKTPPDALDRKEEDTLAPPSRLGVSIPPPAERAVLMALAVNAGQRFQTMGEFQQALLGNAAVTIGFQPAAASFQPAPGPSYTPGAAPVSTPPQPSVYPPPAAPPSHYPQAPRRSANPAAIAAGIGAGVLGLVLLVVLVWRLVIVPPQKIVVEPPPTGGPGPVITEPPPPQRPPKGPEQPPVPPQPPPKPYVPEVKPDPLNRFQVGRQWAIGWQSQSKYWGVMHIRQQLEANRYLAIITVNFFNKNKQITVSMDGRLTINGKDVVINCSNASESWWDTDDFYLEWHNDTMTGYNIDKRGRKGNAVFRFVERATEVSREQQLALSQLPGSISPVIRSPGAGQGSIDYLQLLQAQVKSIKLYERGKEEIPLQNRVYKNQFLKSATRSIACETFLFHPRPNRRSDFPIKAVWRRSDGNIIREQQSKSYIEPNWNDSHHGLWWGSLEYGGFWHPGDYRVDIYIGDKKIGSRTFQVVAQ